MDRFLAALNKLQDVFTTSGIPCSDVDLPQIVVVGSQSSGKSSVLESIAKQNFLPRGNGIVTRRPLVLQMIKEDKEHEVGGENRHTWATFLHSPDRVFTDMSQIQDEIIADTERICGKDKGISDKAIHLKLHSTKIPSLTLVDLPGLTKISVGDQPKDIDKKIEKLVRSYVSKPNSIILAVSPGNVDIANSDSLRLARTVDPTGSRTLAVVTKCDLMERGKEAYEVLEGSKVGMKLGLIGVINRNNDMLKQDISLERVQEMEETFFREEFPDIADRMGTKYLSNQLCDILISHLRKCLPEVSEKIGLQREKHKTALEEVGEQATDPRQALVTLLNKFTDSIKQSIDGKYSFPTKQGGKEECYSAGAELFKVFKAECIDRMSDIRPDKGLDNLPDQIENNGGIQPSLFIDEGVFNTLVTKQLHLLDYPTYHAIDRSHSSLKKSVELIAKNTLGAYPALEGEVAEICCRNLVDQMELTKTFMKQYLANERSYINTNHPDFIDRFEVAANMFHNSANVIRNRRDEELAKKQENQYQYMKVTTGNNTAFSKLMNRSDRGEKVTTEGRSDNEAELMHKLIIQYFTIIRGQLIDVLIKSIMRFMVRDLTDKLSHNLMKTLYTTEGRIMALVQEADHVTRKRQSSSKMLSVLAKAENLISDIAVGRVIPTTEKKPDIDKEE